MRHYTKLLFLCLLASVATATAEINIRVINNNPNFNDSNAFLRFESAQHNLSGTIQNAPLIAKKSYSFAEVKSGINLQYDIGGRIYFSLGAPLNDLYPPEPNNPAIPSYHARFDKIELTYDANNPYSVANLTIIDFFSIPLCLKTYKNGVLVKSLDLFVDGNTMIQHLAQLTQNNPQAVIKERGKFLRVLGPPNPALSDVYPSMKDYIATIKASSQSFQIQDHYYHDGNTLETMDQEYYFSGTFNSHSDLLLQGGGDAIGGNHTILIRYHDLLQGIYGCNPTYFVDNIASNIGQNNVYSSVVRDTVAGFNLGFIGSLTPHPITGQPMGTMPSRAWWESHCPAFEFLQPDKPFYNQWARYVSENSNSYSFPFSDVWHQVQIPLMDIDTLEITVKPDTLPPNYFFSSFIKRKIPKAVNKIFGSHIKKIG